MVLLQLFHGFNLLHKQLLNCAFEINTYESLKMTSVTFSNVKVGSANV